MGNNQSYFSSKPTQQLAITTINYSGILNSPFEFYSSEFKNEQERISQIFQSLMKKEFPTYQKTTFKWNLGKIDQKMQKERYTPLYQQCCGIKDGKKLILNQNQFEHMWNKEFNNNIGKIQEFKYDSGEKARALKFDWLCYKAILLYTYDVREISEIFQQNTAPYQRLMKKFYQKSFLNEIQKIIKLLKSIENQNTDILFIQEASKNLIKNFDRKQFTIIQNKGSDSIIVLRTKKFKKIHDQENIMEILGEKISDEINWNKDSTIAFADNLILISAHLSSKADKNKQQVDLMYQTLKKFKNIYPSNHIIIGCDANTCLKNLPSSFSKYPNREEEYTTLKKRTMLQPQVNKAQIEAKESRDYLITDLALQKTRVVSILNIQSQKVGYLPCDSHPYDHFAVKAQVKTK